MSKPISPSLLDYYADTDRPETTAETVLGYALAIFIGFCLAMALVHWWSN